MLKLLTVWITINCGNFFKRWEYDHLTCLLRNLCAGQEATVRTGMEPQTGSKLQMEYSRLYIVTCLFNFSAEYIMRNAELDEAQAGLKTAGKSIKNFRYAVANTLMAESKEELSSLLLMKVKEESEKAGLKLSIQTTNIMAYSPITSWPIDGETMDTDRLPFLGLQNHCRW